MCPRGSIAEQIGVKTNQGRTCSLLKIIRGTCVMSSFDPNHSDYDHDGIYYSFPNLVLFYCVLKYKAI